MLENFDSGTFNNLSFTSRCTCKFLYIEDKLIYYLKIHAQKYKQYKFEMPWTISSINVCDRFYVREDIFEGQFCVMPNTIKNQYILKFKILGRTSRSL